MGIIEDIKRMQLEGRQEQDIGNVLQARGYAQQEIAEALAQSRIKEAVAAPSSSDAADAPSLSAPSSMQPSMLNQEQAAEELSPSELPTAYPPLSPAGTTEYSSYTAPATQPYGAYQDTGYYAAAPSADTIAEIADQVVAETLHPLQQDLTTLLDRSHLFENKLAELDERLKRIERILDRLQLSILQKVGEYMSNVADLKNEVIETQKSFKALLPASASTAAQAAE